MAKGYWLVSADIVDHDSEALELYLAESDKALRKFGARLLARGGKSETVEGKGRSQFGLVEFKDYTTALECYRSAEYTIARSAAKDKVVFDVVLTEGCSSIGGDVEQVLQEQQKGAARKRALNRSPDVSVTLDEVKPDMSVSSDPASMTFDPANADWFRSTFGSSLRAPSTLIATSWDPHSEWGKRAHTALARIEVDYVKSLLTGMRDQNVEGDLAEFGIFEGYWISKLWELTEEIGFNRSIYGFDSFEGLSEPHSEYDSTFWKRGMYACSLDKVRENVKAAKRPRIHLIKGFFEDSLKMSEAQAAKRFCLARIDCDIYEPALQCLRYLGPRLSDGAILVFDDWPHQRGIGEQKAFEEWLLEVPHLRFEFLLYNTWGHFYMKVRHR